MRFADQRRLVLFWCVAFLAVAAVFTLGPQVDLAVSGWFYERGQGFPLARSATLEALRQTIWNASNLMVLLAAVAAVAAMLRRPLPFLDLRQASFVLLVYLLGPVLLADGILKRFWGRARPDTVEAFGGTLHFTPPLVPSDQCPGNCSFVSGEGAAATALAISLLVVAPWVRRAAPGWLYALFVLAAIAVPLAGLALRIMFGRHFLSDTLFAVLFVSAIALALRPLVLTRRQP